ncbi:MAG TPA: thiamine-phosphate kinase [Acidobacteriaceae bacterium]|nr:thiamine-phosphate kinase [Acidobacteriaceae bacterium]
MSRRISGELEVIAAIQRKARPELASSRAVRTGIGDDCAILRPKAGYEICVTTDFTLEERHFRRAWHPPESVGHRCLARGLSDLAAMGAEPLAVFLSLAVPARLPSAWVDRFLHGFLALARRHRVALAGGDTAESAAVGKTRDGLIAADVVAIGQAPRGRAVLRSGARPGDAIYVTGALGGAAAEFAQLAKTPRRFAGLTKAEPGHPHLYPEPRLEAGLRLRELAHAMIDESDGLSTDLTHVCEESDVAAVIEEALLPIDPRAARAQNPLEVALHGGEDYELLFTAPAAARIPRRLAGTPVHRIGSMVRRASGKPRILLEAVDGKRVAVRSGGWEHFR